MPIEVLMPALSPTMEEGTLAKWTVKPGDTVKSGDVIAEIETDKATMEVEAVEEGVVGKLLVEEGAEGVKVNAVIALLLEEGEDERALEGPDPAARRLRRIAGRNPPLRQRLMRPMRKKSRPGLTLPRRLPTAIAPDPPKVASPKRCNTPSRKPPIPKSLKAPRW